MKIVCLAWGSLVWKPGQLRLSSEWRPKGPELPIEFARVGDLGELATVITPGQVPMGTRWAWLDETDLKLACAQLQAREAIKDHQDIGTFVCTDPRDRMDLEGSESIARWALAADGIDAVIWTASPPRFENVEGRVPHPADAARYLRGLEGQTRAHAEDYVMRVPQEVQTPNRRVLEHIIGRA